MTDEAPLVDGGPAADEAEAAEGSEGSGEVDPTAVLAAERDEYLDSLRRLQADFENYRKRVMKQQAELAERAAESLVEKLLDVLDTFDLAVAHGEGMAQGYAKLVEALEKEGLERIDPEGQPFDPTEHDAVAHEAAQPSEAEGADGSGGADGSAGVAEVSGVMRPGYRWKGRVLRPAMVRVRG